MGFVNWSDDLTKSLALRQTPENALSNVLIVRLPFFVSDKFGFVDDPINLFMCAGELKECGKCIAFPCQRIFRRRFQRLDDCSPDLI